MKIAVQHHGERKFDMVGWLRGDARRILLVASIDERDRLRTLHPDAAHRIEWWKDAMETLPVDCAEVGIDSAEQVLQEIFTSRLKRITINK